MSTEHHLYTYLPKSADVKKDGLRSIVTLNGDEWKKYTGRTEHGLRWRGRRETRLCQYRRRDADGLCRKNGRIAERS